MRVADTLALCSHARSSSPRPGSSPHTCITLYTTHLGKASLQQRNQPYTSTAYAAGATDTLQGRVQLATTAPHSLTHARIICTAIQSTQRTRAHAPQTDAPYHSRDRPLTAPPTVATTHGLATHTQRTTAPRHQHVTQRPSRSGRPPTAMPTRTHAHTLRTCRTACRANHARGQLTASSAQPTLKPTTKPLTPHTAPHPHGARSRAAR